MLNNIGAIYFSEGDDTKALENYLESLRISEELGDTLRIATALVNIGAVYSQKKATYDKAVEFYLKALPLSELLGDHDAIGTTAVNLGGIYLEREEVDSALFYFEKSLVAYRKSSVGNVPFALYNMGKAYAKRKNYPKAISYQKEAFELAKQNNSKLEMAQSLVGLADAYKQQGNIKLAIPAYLQAESISTEIGATYEQKTAYEGLALSYAEISDFHHAYKYQALLTGIKDTIYNAQMDKRLQALQFNFDIEKKEGEIEILTKDKELQDLEMERQKVVRNALVGGLFLILVIAFILVRSIRNKIKTNRLLDKQKAEIENLILNILPAKVAKELQESGSATPHYYDSASVLFTDFKGFTKIAEGLSPNELVDELNDFFVAFDDIVETHNLEKIKTIGDAYMCAGGIPTENNTHPLDIVRAGLAMQEYMRKTNEKRKAKGAIPWELRVGIHTGPIVAGVVGKKKYAYDIWGNSVNISSRMESNGEPGEVNISASTYELIKDRYSCHYRGKISAKNIGEIDMYFVEAEINQ